MSKGTYDEYSPILFRIYNIIEKYIIPSNIYTVRGTEALNNIDFDKISKVTINGDFCLFVNSTESAFRSICDYIHKKIVKYNIDPQKIIYCNADLNIEENYKKWLNFEMVSDNDTFFTTKPSGIYDPINVIGIDFSYITMNNRLLNEFNIIKPHNPSKIFLCMNNKRNKPRGKFLNALHEKKIYDFGHISVGWENKYLEGRDKMVNKTEDQVFLKRNSNIDKFYNDSWFSVVFETKLGYESLYNWRPMHISEKTYNPISAGHPFIINGNKGTLEYLRGLGFETYPELFDESYDIMEERPYKNRIEHIVLEIEKICKMSNSNRKELFMSVRNKIEYNQHLLYSEYIIPEKNFISKLEGILNG